MTKEIRIVLAGCGGISGVWLKSLQKIEGIAVVGLVDINADAALRRKEEFALAAAQTGTDLRAMLKATKANVVFDCTVPEAHLQVEMEAFRRGCHVLSEKPLADSMAHARRMVAASKKAGVLYAVMQNRRYQPEIRAFRQLIESGSIGELTTLNGDFYIGAHFGGFRDRMKHVLLLDMAIHTFDAARYVAGADAVAVYCHEWNPRGSWYDHDASAIAVFEMSNGVVYTYRGSWCSEGLNTTWECDWRAIGSKGSAIWNGADAFRAQDVEKTGSFFSTMKDVPVPIPVDAKRDSHLGCIRDFIDCVRTGRKPETVCTDNIKSLAMVFGAIQSAETGKRVTIKV
jgi:predicted dehydrogenase